MDAPDMDALAQDAEDPLVATVRTAWADTLGLEPEEVPLDQGFFDAGGNSLLLLLLWEELSGHSGGTLRATDLFQHPTVLAQAALLAGGA